MSSDSRSDSAPAPLVEDARRALRAAREAVASAERALGQMDARDPDSSPEKTQERADRTWREKLWTAPAECRIGIQELTEALGVSKSWAYNRTKEKADPRLPHAKIGGALVFKCGEVRAWIRDHEEVEVAYRMESSPGELRRTA